YYNEDKRIVAEAVIEADGKPRILYVYIYDTNGAIIGRQDAASGKVQYYQLNGHGDVVSLTDDQGSKLNEYRYDIWGLPLESKETVPNIFGYAGEYWDAVSDLQYLRARWYDPSMGRFISEDKNQGKIEEPDTLNRYTYVENNPLNGVDPTGEYRLECAFQCFSAGTKIQTDEGLKAIEDIQVGDKVLAKSEETGETAYKAVEETFNRTADEVYVIEVKQEKITTTEEHPFWIVDKGWVEAGDLSVGDKLVDRDGQEYPIESITVRKEPTKVYNFRVQGYHNYFVTDLRIWTHNCGGGGGGRGIGSSTSNTIYSSPGNVSRGSNLLTKNVPVPDVYQKLIRDQFNSFKAPKGTGNANQQAESLWRPTEKIADLWSKGKLKTHYHKHGDEFGAKSSSEYSDMAHEFATRKSDRIIQVKDGAFIYRYEPSTKSIFVGTDIGGKIKSFYKWDGRPDDAVILTLKGKGLIK
ncbi:Hint domain-containing protein, partial [Paenibacillus sp. ACRRX]|uniref:polymorphic toxin-type HINT domain-containing protein n=1 Tax=Paenibacillus sp. ACRRX TaxID=2918206 RepID=UPI001EF4CBEB